MPARTASANALAALLTAASTGDELAFADLYDEVGPRVYAMVLRVLRDVHQSEEVTQEVFLEIWQTSHRFDPARGSAFSWLMTMAHRRAIDRVRRSEASRRRDAADAARSRSTAYDQTAVEAHASLDAQTVRAALATLSPGQREALELSYFGGFTHTEISRMLQLPLGTAKSRIRDGLTRLRLVMAPGTTEPV